jgi:F-type H+-transporting ATPase subunit delta
MAELATIARPYAEALFKAAGADAAVLKAPLASLADVAGHPSLRQFADNPKVASQQVYDVVTSVVTGAGALDPRLANLLRADIDNGRLAALGEVSAQYTALVNARSGVSDATVYSAFPIEAAQLADVAVALERRFGRKLNPTVQIDPELIGGIRVVVGDEVLDTSVRARLEQMKAALVA